MVLAQARRYGIKIIGEFDGDANGTEPYGPPKSGADGHGEHRLVLHVESRQPGRLPDGDLRGPAASCIDYERHMKAVLDHVNPYTGLAYKNDPTFAGWVDGNNLWLLNPTPLPTFQPLAVEGLLATSSRSITGSCSSTSTPPVLTTCPRPRPTASGPNLGPGPARRCSHIPGIDVYGEEWYPKDFTALDPTSPAATQLHVNAHAVAAARKVYATIEFGWDHDNYVDTSRVLRRSSPAWPPTYVSGELFWELVAHANGHGWQPDPRRRALHPDLPRPGRGRQLVGAVLHRASRPPPTPPPTWRPAPSCCAPRRTGWTVSGACPAHETPAGPDHHLDPGRPDPVRGQRRAPPRYSVQQLRGGRWTTPCRRCTTDNDDGWQSTMAAARLAIRVIALNLAGRGRSRPRCRPGCRLPDAGSRPRPRTVASAGALGRQPGARPAGRSRARWPACIPDYRRHRRADRARRRAHDARRPRAAGPAVTTCSAATTVTLHRCAGRGGDRIRAAATVAGSSRRVRFAAPRRSRAGRPRGRLRPGEAADPGGTEPGHQHLRAGVDRHRDRRRQPQSHQLHLRARATSTAATTAASFPVNSPVLVLDRRGRRGAT